MGIGLDHPWPGPDQHEPDCTRHGSVTTVPGLARHGPKKRAMPGSSTVAHGSSPARPIRAYSLSVIIATILAFVFLASASIHPFLRFITRSSGNSPSSSSSFSSSMPPLIHHCRSFSATADSLVLSDEEKAVLIESLPLFSLASSIAVLPRSSLDYVVCLSPFHPHDELCLLPTCRHTFHSPYIDTYLRSTSLPLLHLPPRPAPPAACGGDSRGSSKIQ